MIFLELFWGFLQVGMFSFGGGYSAIPLIRDLVLSKGWLTDPEISYIIAIGESTPGPVMVNMATYVGNVIGGFWGAFLATFAVVLPSFFIILLVMVILKNVLKNRFVKAALKGMKSCIIGIILATGCTIIFKNCFAGADSYAPDLRSILVTVVLVLIYYAGRVVFKKKMSPVTLLVISAFIGAFIFR